MAIQSLVCCPQYGDRVLCFYSLAGISLLAFFIARRLQCYFREAENPRWSHRCSNVPLRWFGYWGHFIGEHLVHISHPWWSLL